MRVFPQRKQRQARIEIIPMIDVMMFLLAFFVLISTNVLPALGLKVELPQSAQTERIKEPKRLTLTIDAEGHYYLEGEAIEAAALVGKLRGMAASDDKPAVIIAGDGGANLQKLVDALDLLKEAGIPAASIIAKAR